MTGYRYTICQYTSYPPPSPPFPLPPVIPPPPPFINWPEQAVIERIVLRVKHVVLIYARLMYTICHSAAEPATMGLIHLLAVEKFASAFPSAPLPPRGTYTLRTIVLTRPAISPRTRLLLQTLAVSYGL